MTDPKCWEQAANRWVDQLTAEPVERVSVLNSLETHALALLDLAQHHGDGKTRTAVATSRLRHMAKLAVQLDGSRELLVRNAKHVLPRKQHDYGHGNILTTGLTGIAVRISDKVQRLIHLNQSNTPPVNEAWNDSVLDLFGYCVIGCMFLEGTFTLPLSADVAADSVGEPNPNVAGMAQDPNLILVNNRGM